MPLQGQLSAQAAEVTPADVLLQNSKVTGGGGDKSRAEGRKFKRWQAQVGGLTSGQGQRP